MATTLTPALRKQSRESPFIFLGRVTAVGENNLQGFAATDRHFPECRIIAARLIDDPLAIRLALGIQLAVSVS